MVLIPSERKMQRTDGAARLFAGAIDELFELRRRV